jgi:hypothetical protein
LEDSFQQTEHLVLQGVLANAGLPDLLALLVLLELLGHREKHLPCRDLLDLLDLLDHREKHQLYLGLLGLLALPDPLGHREKHQLYLGLLGLLGLQDLLDPLDRKAILDLPGLRELVFNSRVLLHL